MDIKPPTWSLKAERCCYCEADELVFSQCPSCRVSVFICAECGTVFEIQDCKRGREAGDLSGATRCHACASSFHHNFTPVPSAEIQSLGFTAGDYR
jgi:hypothetical protein